MSKTQDKRAARVAEQQEFIKKRRIAQLAVFESNFNAGLQFYNDNKDKMSEEEIALIDKEIEDNLALIHNIKKEWGLDGAES
jgi:hypothetical protein